MRLKITFTILCLYFFYFGYAQESQTLVISFDGQDWYEQFSKRQTTQLFNAPYALNSKKPHYLWRENGIKGNALLFDGYSTYMVLKDFILPQEEFTISFWIAPRAFDSGIDDKISSIIDHSKPQSKTGFNLGIFKHGTLMFKYGNGESWTTLQSTPNSLAKNKWNQVTLTKSQLNISLFINGQKVAENHSDTTDSDLIIENETTTWFGRNKIASGFGDKFKFNMISGLLDEVKFYSKALDEETIKQEFNTIKNVLPSLEEAKADLALDFSKYQNEHYRPSYHATAPAHWMNEPHAPFYYKGKYHLFYQHNPFGPYWGQIHWGHWVSDDMINWEHADIALSPEYGELDPDGIWSGSAFVGPGNEPLLFYTAANLDKDQNQYVSIAYPADTSDVYLQSWEKTGIIVNKPEEYKKNEFRDPFVFKHDEKYYMLVGSGIENKGGTAALFESKDAKNWDYLHPFYMTDIQKYPYMGGVWELPVFLPLNQTGNNESDKYIFMVLPLRDEADVEVFYWIGEFDDQQLKFVPDNPEPQLMDYGDFGFTGPSGFVDPKTNRTIVFSIAQGKYGDLDTYDMGWAHNAGLPIQLSLDESGDLAFKPIEETKKLRSKTLFDCQNCRLDEINTALKQIEGDQLEVQIAFEPSGSKQGLSVRKSVHGLEENHIYYDEDNKEVVFQKKGKEKENTLRAPVNLDRGILNLRVFLDKSMIEIYINNQSSITNRIYGDPNAKGLELLGPDDLKVNSLKIWKLKNINWKYAEEDNH